MEKFRSTIVFCVIIVNITVVGILLTKFTSHFLTGMLAPIQSFRLFYSVFYLCGSVTFLMLWVNHLKIIKEIPSHFKEKWFGISYTGDNTMLLCSLIILSWQIENVTFFFQDNRFLLFIRACSAILNCVFWLKIVSRFQVISSYVWLEAFRIKKPIYLWSSLALGLIGMLTFLIIPYEDLIFLPEIIISFVMSFFLFTGLVKVFVEQEMSTLWFLIVVNFVLMSWDLINKLIGNFDGHTLNISVYIHTGNTMTLITLSFALVIAHHTSIRKLYLNELNKELKNKNDQLEILKDEVSHRVKNHFRIILLGIERQIQKRQTLEHLEATAELQAVRARVNAIFGVHESLYSSSPKNYSLRNISLSDYLTTLLKRLKDSFAYPSNCFEYQIQISDIIKVKDSIAPQIGMLITELCLNVDQHAYMEDELHKHVKINIRESNGNLLLIVQDYGKGMEINKKPNGQGLSIVQAIADQIGGTFQLIKTDPGVMANISLALKNLL